MRLARSQACFWWTLPHILITYLDVNNFQCNLHIDGWAEENAISAEANRRFYLGRGSQNVLSRPRLTKDAYSAEAHRTCYLGRGSQNVQSRPGLAEDSISTQAHKRAISDAFFFFKFCSASPVCALIKPLFQQNWCLKSWKILHVILWRWFRHRRVGDRRPISARRIKTSHLSSARKNVPSRLCAWERPTSGVSCVDVVNKA